MTITARQSSVVTLATCNLNQWALDFDGNARRILESCQEAKELGASYRLGPELEICGYGCEDHFLEGDTFDHCWESLVRLLDEGATDDLLCDFGMPVLHGGVRYNCRVLCRNRKVLMIRPKMALADNGNYREGRYFTAYAAPPLSPETHLLPPIFRTRFGQRDAPFGLCHLHCADGTTIGCESCEELWTPLAAHIDLALRGVEIIGNGSGSHHELRKLATRMELMVSATRRCGGVYLYSNQRGCDGGRTYYDGSAMIVVNGRIVAQAPQFDVRDVHVIAATVDLEDVRSYRASQPSFGAQAARAAAKEDGRGGGHGLRCDDVTLAFDPADTGSPGVRRPPLSEQSMALKIASPEEEVCVCVCVCVKGGYFKFELYLQYLSSFQLVLPRPGLLVVGLPAAVGRCRLLPALERRGRLLLHRGHCGCDVRPRHEGRARRPFGGRRAGLPPRVPEGPR